MAEERSADQSEVILKTEEFEKLKEQAGTDQLTGVCNRRSGEEQIRALLSECENGAFLMLDLDCFKSVNDTRGHAVGDEVLERFSKILGSLARKEDVVCRYGGDEFCVFFRELTDPEVIAKRCIRLIAETEDLGTELLDDDMLASEFSVSVGVALYPEDGADMAELARNADKALYEVKQNGGHGYYFYSGKYGSTQNAENRSGIVDMDKLRVLLEESGHPNGAYSVDSGDFRKIFRFLARYVERSGAGVQLVVLTMKEDGKESGSAVQEGGTLKSEHQLGQVIEKTLRRGDVAAQYGVNQFLLLLMDTNTENGKIAVNRVINNWKKLYPDNEIEYEIQSITLDQPEDEDGDKNRK